MTIKQLVIVALMSLGLFASQQASAVCSFTGKVERVFQNSTTTYAYLVPERSVINSSAVYFRTTDPDLSQSFHEAMDDNNSFHVVGNASSCPTSGTYRNGGIAIYTNRY
jgi:hypothetical protein